MKKAGGRMRVKSGMSYGERTQACEKSDRLFSDPASSQKPCKTSISSSIK